MSEKTAKKGSALEKPTPSRLLTEFEEMDRVFDRMFDEFFPRGWLRPFHWRHGWFPEPAFETRAPRVNLIDREEDVLIRAELPGIKKEDLSVSLTDDTVTIQAEEQHEEKKREETYYRHETVRGSFARTLSLPCSVKGKEARAHFEDGVLELTLPKVEKAKRVTVKVE